MPLAPFYLKTNIRPSGQPKSPTLDSIGSKSSVINLLFPVGDSPDILAEIHRYHTLIHFISRTCLTLLPSSGLTIPMFSIVSNYYHPSLESGSDTCLNLFSISKGATYLVPMDLDREKIASVQESSYKDYLLLSVLVVFPHFFFYKTSPFALICQCL